MYSREELRQAGLLDFRRFLFQVWDYLGLPDPTAAQLDIAKLLQTGPRRMIIQAFRGVGKSWITVAFCLWLLLVDPQKKILVVSAGGDLAKDFTKFALDLIRGMPLLQHLEPQTGQRESFVSFDVAQARESKDPSVKSAGITGQITGTRADYIIPDDIEIPKNSFTHHLREKLSDQVKEFDAILKPGGRIVYLGTPQVEDTVYNKLVKRGYERVVIPARIPEKPDVYRGTLAPMVMDMLAAGTKPGTPVDPLRFPEEEIAERLASYGRSGFALQFMLDTSLSDIERHPLKCRDLGVMDLDRDMGHVKVVWGQDKDNVIQELQCGGYDGDYYCRPTWKSDELAPWQQTVAWIDPSGKGRDETALAIVRYHHGQLYLVHVSGYRDGYADATLRAVALQMIRFRVGHFVIEKNFGGGMFNELLKPVLAQEKALFAETEGVPLKSLKGPIEDEEFKAWASTQTSKEWRILDTLEPLLGGHRLFVDRRVIDDDNKMVESGDDTAIHYSLIYQMTRMERVKGALPFDDRVEAVAGACQYLAEKMKLDRTKALEKHKSNLLDQELDRLRRHYFNMTGGKKRPNWTQGVIATVKKN